VKGEAWKLRRLDNRGLLQEGQGRGKKTGGQAERVLERSDRGKHWGY
jgi:hypothetical protein